MEFGLLLEYGWVLLILVGLEGLLAADNALVLAVMVKPLSPKNRKKALFYGLGVAFILRFLALFVIAFLVNVWQVQAIGAAYLLFLSIRHIYLKLRKKEPESKAGDKDKESAPEKEPSLWATVFKVELADMAFAVDSILAAVALAMALPKTGLPNIGGLDGGKFLVVFAGGMIGIIIMRFAANLFVSLLVKRPGLEIAAYLIVGWVGVKLVVLTLAHEKLALLPEAFAHSPAWKATFYVVLVLIAVGGWVFSKKKAPVEKAA